MNWSNILLPYSPNLAFSDFYLFLNFMEISTLKVFSSNEEIKATVNQDFYELPGNHFKDSSLKVVRIVIEKKKI